MDSTDWNRVRQFNRAAQVEARDAILEKEGIRHRISEGTASAVTDPRPFRHGNFARSLPVLRRGRMEEEPKP